MEKVRAVILCESHWKEGNGESSYCVYSRNTPQYAQKVEMLLYFQRWRAPITVRASMTNRLVEFGSVLCITVCDYRDGQSMTSHIGPPLPETLGLDIPRDHIPQFPPPSLFVYGECQVSGPGQPSSYSVTLWTRAICFCCCLLGVSL